MASVQLKGVVDLSSPLFALNQLRCFIAVANELNFRRAAARINMTQPPLTRQIQLLEHALNVRLFDRNKRSVRLTSAGIAFLPYAIDLLKRAEEASMSARMADRGEAGSISLGFVPFTAIEYIPRIVSKLSAELPGVQLVLKELMSFEQVEELSTGRLDLGITRLPRSQSTIQFRRLVSEPYLLAVHRDHPLASMDRLTLKHLDGVDFIMYGADVGRYSFEVLSGLFTSAGVRPNYVQYVSQPHSFLGLVNASIGVALIPASAGGFRLDNVIFKEIELSADTRSEICLAFGEERATPLRDNVAALISEALCDLDHYVQPE